MSTSSSSTLMKIQKRFFSFHSVKGSAKQKSRKYLKRAFTFSKEPAQGLSSTLIFKKLRAEMASIYLSLGKILFSSKRRH
jgi:hypothetical protein